MTVVFVTLSLNYRLQRHVTASLYPQGGPKIWYNFCTPLSCEEAAAVSVHGVRWYVGC